MVVGRMAGKRRLPPVVRAENLEVQYELFLNWGPTHQIWHDQIWEPGASARDRTGLSGAGPQADRQSQALDTASESVAMALSRQKEMAIQKLDPMPPDRVVYLLTHRLPRLGAREGLAIMRNLAGEAGFMQG